MSDIDAGDYQVAIVLPMPMLIINVDQLSI